MEVFLIQHLIKNLEDGKKDIAVLCLVLFVAYRFYKLVKFTFFELKKRDVKISELEERIKKQEEIENNREE